MIVEREEYVIDFVTGKRLRKTPEEEVRQLFERKLVEEYGYSKDQIDINVRIKSGRGYLPKKADIVVFKDSRNKRPEENAYIIVETKTQERKEGIDQLETYINNTTAEFGVWFNGKDIVYKYRLRKPHAFRDIPDIPRKGETLEDIGLYYKKDLVPATELKTVFEVCHNYIYANEGLLKEKVFDEVLKLIFIKMVDEKSSNPKCEFRITEKEMEEVEEGKKNAFVDRVLNLFERVKKELPSLFDPYERINLKPVTLAFVVGKLQRYNLINTPVDVKGTAFQTFVYAHQRGERGEFFTPYPIIELAVKMLNPKDYEMIIDPACGSGGFLIRAMRHVWEQVDRDRPDLNEAQRKELKIKYARSYVRGIDFNPVLARVSKMHMVLYDDGHTGIFSCNSLLPFDKINEAALKAGAGEIKPESFDVVLTNPPFGSRGKVSDKTILQNFELGYKWKKDEVTGKWVKTNQLLDAQVPDILFVERCLQFLRDGGRMAIVLPDGDLNDTSLEYVRDFIRNKARILAVVSLPKRETFYPHGAGTQASVLFLQKLNEEELEELKRKDYPIFMAVSERIGYDIRARTVYKRDEKGDLIRNEKGEPIVDTDIPEVVEAFEKFKKQHNLPF